MKVFVVIDITSIFIEDICRERHYLHCTFLIIVLNKKYTFQNVTFTRKISMWVFYILKIHIVNDVLLSTITKLKAGG